QLSAQAGKDVIPIVGRLPKGAGGRKRSILPISSPPVCLNVTGEKKSIKNSRPLPDVAMTGKCTRECDEYGHSDSCWMPVRTSPERRPPKSTTTPQQPKLSTFMSGNGSSSSSSSSEQPDSQETLAMAAMANGDPTAAHMMGDRNRNLLNKKMASSSSSYEAFGSPSYGSPGNGEEVLHHPTEEIPLAPTGEYKPTSCGTLTRREVYL
ncbi:Protocadherin-9, partial [Dissostichus eleginoides]